MTDKHTPGPWELGDNGDKLRIWHVARMRAGVADVCVRRSINTKGPSSEEFANARLIAAAPDLLAALFSAASAMESLAEYTGDSENRKMLQINAAAARAAIAKAEGK